MSLWDCIFAALYEPVLRVSERNGLADLHAGLLERHEHFPKAARILQPLTIGRATR